MTVVVTRIRVAADGAISGRAPDLPPGEHVASVTVGEAASAKPFSVRDLPMHGVPWNGSVSLRRDEMYDDEGRLR